MLRLSFTLALVGCCSAVAPTDPVATPAAEPALPSVPSPAPPTPAAPTEECRTLCERNRACALEDGTELDADLDNCFTACAEGGRFTTLAPLADSCIASATCDEFRECLMPAMATQLMGSMGLAAPGIETAESWPEGMPQVEGGSAIPSASIGPVRIGILSYQGTNVTQLADQYRALFREQNFQIVSDDHSEMMARLVVVPSGGNVASDSISLSIYQEGTQTYAQTTQLTGALSELGGAQ